MYGTRLSVFYLMLMLALGAGVARADVFNMPAGLRSVGYVPEPGGITLVITAAAVLLLLRR